MSPHAHFERAGPLLEGGDELCFHAFEVFADLVCAGFEVSVGGQALKFGLCCEFGEQPFFVL